MTVYKPINWTRCGAFLVCVSSLLFGGSALAETQLSIMSFNIWGGGLNDGQSVLPTVAALRASGADIIGLQEVRAESESCSGQHCPAEDASVASALADALGFYLYEQQAKNEAVWGNAILSRYPFGEPTPNDLGVQIDVDSQVVYLFNIHATDYPYQPFQLLSIPYDGAPFLSSSEDAVSSAEQTRAGALKLLLQDLAFAKDAALVAITGDFNEPSHRDWTPAAVRAGLQPMVVTWPFTRALEAEGFVDAYRSIYPNEVTNPGFTWSPLISVNTTDDHRDRIDYVFIRGNSVNVTGAAVMGENQANADIVVKPWPSDHRAVIARVWLPHPE